MMPLLMCLQSAKWLYKNAQNAEKQRMLDGLRNEKNKIKFLQAYEQSWISVTLCALLIATGVFAYPPLKPKASKQDNSYSYKFGSAASRKLFFTLALMVILTYIAEQIVCNMMPNILWQTCYYVPFSALGCFHFTLLTHPLIRSVMSHGIEWLKIYQYKMWDLA